MSLRSVNLNLLPILHALLAERSVTRAAQTLGLSQSAVSDALGRLRATFGDKLLVRVGGRMALTPRAVALIEPVERLAGELETLFVGERFDPASARRRFVVATADYGILLVAKAWLDALERAAPGVSLRFAAIDRLLPARLADRSVDFAIVPEPLIASMAPAPLAFAPLAADRAVALFRRGHALDRGVPLERRDLARARLLGFHPGVDEVERRRGDFFSGGAPFETTASLPFITLLPALLPDGDAVAIVPEGLARGVSETLPLAFAPLAFAPDRTTLAIVWSKVQDGDAGHRWFRERIARAGTS